MWKTCPKCWSGRRKPFPKQTIAEVLHVFLASISNEILQNHHFFWWFLKSPWIRNIQQTHGPLEAPEPCFCPCSAACTVMYQAVAVWHELRVFHAGSFLHHGCVDALQPVHSLRSVGCVWTCLGVHGRQPIFWSPCLHVGTSRCLFFWYSFCSVLIGSAWFRSCWQEKPHVWLLQFGFLCCF